MVKVLDGLRAGKTHRGVAQDIWGEARVAEVWGSDSWMRSQVRRWIPVADRPNGATHVRLYGATHGC